MSPKTPRTDAPALALLTWVALAGWLLLVAGCEQLSGPADPSQASGDAASYGIWAPGPEDSCSKEVHDSYAVVGPNGLRYPTWHPPVDPSGCSFGHEHGRDPRGSDIYDDVGPIPFGRAEAALNEWLGGGNRHADHFGHKIEWENDLPMRIDGAAAALVQATCDVLTQLHQGSHSQGAFANHLHEFVYHLRCTDGTAMSFTVLTAIGAPGEFVTSCDRTTILVGMAQEPPFGRGGGVRLIPDRVCVLEHLLVPEGQRSNYHRALRESWEVAAQLKTEDGKRLASVHPYFQILNPARYHDPSQPNRLGRTIDLCLQEVVGRRARGGACEHVQALAARGDTLRWDDPRSPFNGAARFVDINGNRISNADGPEVWYTDPFGRNARTRPFPGSIRQWIARIDNDGRVPHGPVIGRGRDYAGSTAHAPN